jgi:hypothetical protein
MSKYCCDFCAYITNIKQNYDKHILSLKYITNKENKKTKEQIEQELNYECKNCCKKFMSPSGLWKHKQTCIIKPKNEEPIPHTEHFTSQPPTTPLLTKETVKDFFDNNKDFFINMVIDELKNNCGVLENRVITYNNSNEIVKFDENKLNNDVIQIKEEMKEVKIANEITNRRIDRLERKFMEYTDTYCMNNIDYNVFIDELEITYKAVGEAPLPPPIIKDLSEKTLNIVELIDNNPITNITDTYHNKFITKMKEYFTNDEQHLFVASFYCYLNYNKTEFIIDLDNIWEWLGFSRKENAKILLEKQFKVDIDFIASVATEAKKNRGGHNKVLILLTIPAFKRFCLKAGTEKANKIHEYYIKLEEILHEVIKEECEELKIQLENHKIQTIIEKELLRETTLLEQFPLNTECIYIGLIDNTNENNEKLVKFGRSNDLNTRIQEYNNIKSSLQIFV